MSQSNSHIKLIRYLKSSKPKDLDEVTHRFHHEAFEKIDCLACANCCKTLGPRLTQTDIDRLSKHLKMKTEKFIAQFLKTDEDGDFVFQSMPCPFLGTDNYCRVYEKRPKACADYPHTDRRKIHQILNLTLKNSTVCPAVDMIVENLKSHYVQKK